MKTSVLLASALIFSFQCMCGHAGTFTSTRSDSQAFSTSILLRSRITGQSQGKPLSSFSSYSANLLSGVNSATVDVDTESDTGSVSDMDFRPFGLSDRTNGRSVEVEYRVVDVPANFPLPGEAHDETFQYRENVTIAGMSSSGPTLTSSTTDFIQPDYNHPPIFAMTNSLVLDLPSFFVEGTYEVIGPTTTRSIPFNVEFRPASNVTFSQRTVIVGGQDFDDGFPVFLGNNMSVTYNAVNPDVFDEVVDGLRFQAFIDDRDYVLRLWQGERVPEPGTMGLTVATSLALGGVVRWRRTTQRSSGCPDS